ncbi:hypothetical protein Hanom_Chr03g00243051 [Helianthus anomalus]
MVDATLMVTTVLKEVGPEVVYSGGLLWCMIFSGVYRERKVCKDSRESVCRCVYLHYMCKSKLQVFSFMFIPKCKRCPLAQKLKSFVLNVAKSCTLFPLDQTQLIFWLNLVTQGYFCLFIFIFNIIIFKKILLLLLFLLFIYIILIVSSLSLQI